MTKVQDKEYMKLALHEAQKALELGEVPVGAVVICKNEVISTGYNFKEKAPSALAHAELRALEEAYERLGRWRLSDCTLYVTLEPCVMCAGALVASRLERLVYGTQDLKRGGVDSLYSILSDKRLNHRVEVTGGILEQTCSQILKDFFQKKR